MNKLTEEILKHCIDYAVELLIETKEFYPFAAFVYPGEGDNIHPLEFDTEETKSATIGTVIDSLTKFCSEDFRAKTIKAYAIVSEAEVKISEDEVKNCIQVDIVNRDEDGIPLLYKSFTFEDGTLKLEPVFAVAR